MPKLHQPSHETGPSRRNERDTAPEHPPQRHDYAAGADGEEAVEAPGAGTDDDPVETANDMLRSTTNRTISPHSDDVEGAPGRPVRRDQ